MSLYVGNVIINFLNLTIVIKKKGIMVYSYWGFFYECLVGKHLNLKQLYLLMINIQTSLERNMINNWLTLSTTFYTMYLL